MTAYRFMLHSGVSALSYPENKPIILESSMHVFFQVQVQLWPMYKVIRKTSLGFREGKVTKLFWVLLIHIADQC